MGALGPLVLQPAANQNKKSGELAPLGLDPATFGTLTQPSPTHVCLFLIRF
jgi:hypothetical protein